MVKVIDPSLIASCRHKVSVDSASLIIRGVIFATQGTSRRIVSWFRAVF